MIPYKLLAHTRIFSCREALLMDLITRGDVIELDIVAEIGVAYGGFSQIILDAVAPSEFHAFDTFELHEQENVFGSHPSTVLGDQSHWSYYRQRFCNSADYPNTAIYTWEGPSQEQLKLPLDDTFDFAYLDAAHDYLSVTSDIEQLKRIVKPRGVIMFDDYTTYDTIARQDFGVLQAVNEYIEEGHEVLGISLHPEGFHNIAVRA